MFIICLLQTGKDARTEEPQTEAEAVRRAGLRSDGSLEYQTAAHRIARRHRTAPCANGAAVGRRSANSDGAVCKMSLFARSRHRCTNSCRSTEFEIPPSQGSRPAGRPADPVSGGEGLIRVREGKLTATSQHLTQRFGVGDARNPLAGFYKVLMIC